MARSILTRSSSSTQSPTSPSPSVSPSERRKPKAGQGYVSVNLLPRELTERLRARRVTRITVGAVLGFVGLLAGGYALRLSDVAQAEEARDDAQEEVVALETQVAELDEYRRLAEGLDNRSTLLASAMQTEIAFSRVLNDLSLAFPANASLLELTVTAAEVTADATADMSAIDLGESVADAQFSGYSLERYAPGVETVLLDLEGTRALFNPFLTTAAGADIGGTEVTNFNGTVSLDDDAYTGRYADGLPPEDTS